MGVDVIIQDPRRRRVLQEGGRVLRCWRSTVTLRKVKAFAWTSYALVAMPVTMVLTGACTGDLGGGAPPVSSGPPPPEVLEPKDVPAAPDVLESTGACIALQADERLLSVSPEGHAWLFAERGAEVALRVLDPFDPQTPVEETLALAGVQSVRALSGRDATIIADDGLWRLEDLARIQLEPPTGYESPAVMCGDLGTNGILLSQGFLFERRVDDQWWAWNSEAEGEAMPSALLTYDGECFGEPNALWMTSADGTLWRLDSAEVHRPTQFSEFQGAVAAGAYLGVLAEGRLLVGPTPWQPWVFSGPVPTQLSASGDAIWMASGAKLLRLSDETFVEVTHHLEEPISQLAAHAGGVWVVGATQVCHQVLAPMVRVAGLRPYQRVSDAEYTFDLQTNDASMDLSVTLDGEEVSLEPSEQEGWLTGRGNLGAVGWHRFELSASGTGALGTRSMLVKLVPAAERSWATDIAPIFEESCTGSTCHSEGASGDAPPMGTFDAWTSRADLLRVRVVQEKTMPPPDDVGPEWGEDDIQIIGEWLEGGMLP